MYAQRARFAANFPTSSELDRPSTLCSSPSARSLPPGPLPGSAHQVAQYYIRRPNITTSGSVTSARLWAVVWSSSVGSTWTLVLRELDGDSRHGPVRDWISSGEPVSHPQPTALVHELLAARGLRLYCEATGRGTHSRRWLGYVCVTADPVTRVRPPGLALDQLTGGVSVVAVTGELDMVTAPALQTCIRQQLTATPTHLIVDLQSVRFLGVSGLNCLLAVQELAQQTPGSQLHLAGLANCAVARPLTLTGVLKLFNNYPTLADALAALINGRTR